MKPLTFLFVGLLIAGCAVTNIKKVYEYNPFIYA